MNRTGLEAYVTRRWYPAEGEAVSFGALWLLWPLMLLYQTVVTKRWRGQQQSPKTAPLPTVVVGNITSGGTGKTPLVLALVAHFRRRGLRPAIISRGYGGDCQQFPHRVDVHRDDASYVGDEPWMLAQLSEVPVIIDPQRARAAAALADGMAGDIDVLISDDGLQHYALGRDVEVLVVDSQRGFGNGRCLPLGPLREPMSRLNTVDAIVLNGAELRGELQSLDDSLAGAEDVPELAVMQLRESGFYRVSDSSPVEAEYIAALKRSEALANAMAVAAIGNPQRFFNSLQALGLRTATTAYADHHRYSPEDFAGCKGPVFMTEKDAVKCRDFARDDWFYLRVEADLPGEFFAAVDAALQANRAVLGENK